MEFKKTITITGEFFSVQRKVAKCAETQPPEGEIVATLQATASGKVLRETLSHWLEKEQRWLGYTKEAPPTYWWRLPK